MEGASTRVAVDQNTTDVSPKTPPLNAALVVAIVADLIQLVAFPLFMEGAASPVDDVLDLVVAGALTYLLGWHWEFAPSFLGELIPGLDFVPFWTLAVANVYRKSKQIAPGPQGPVIEGEPVRKG